VHHTDLAFVLEQFEGDVRRQPDAGAAERNGIRRCLGLGDQALQVAEGSIRRRNEYGRAAREFYDGREVFQLLRRVGEQ